MRDHKVEKRSKRNRLGFGIRKPYPNPNKLDKTKYDLKEKNNLCYCYVNQKNIDKSCGRCVLPCPLDCQVICHIVDLTVLRTWWGLLFSRHNLRWNNSYSQVQRVRRLFVPPSGSDTVPTGMACSRTMSTW